MLKALLEYETAVVLCDRVYTHFTQVKYKVLKADSKAKMFWLFISASVYACGATFIFSFNFFAYLLLWLDVYQSY